MDKTAVDNAANKYWSTYFKEYGKMWVRNIPKRIKTAMLQTKELGVKTAEGNIVPVAYDISDSGVLSLEAAFSGKLDDQDAKVLVMAEFTEEGKLRKFEATRISQDSYLMNLYEACKILGIWHVAKARAEVWSISSANEDSLEDLKNLAKTAFKRLAMEHHPDKGGDQNNYLEIQEAFNLIKEVTAQAVIDALDIEKKETAEYYNPGIDKCWGCTKWSSMVHACLTIQCTGFEAPKKRKFGNIRGQTQFAVQIDDGGFAQ